VARDWASAYMRSGGWAGGYVIYKEFLNEEQQKQIRSSIPDIRRGGTEDIGKMGLLQGGPTIHNGSVSPKDSQFIESRQFEDEEISGAMGVPLWLINRMRTGSYVGNGLEQQIIAFVMFGLNPFLQIIE
uniref:phage portal protein n=1 Tax=Escherichia coli TaxID=562 RepID=UPI00137B101B